MLGRNYFLKIIILFVATFAGIFIIWFSLIREESSDWIVAQVAHQVSPYAVVITDNGTVIINNVVAGHEFKLPPGFKTNGARNLSMYLEENGKRKCEIRHQAKGLIFELADKGERQDCEKYIEEIKNSVITN